MENKMEDKFDMAVIGGGPGGYVAALRGAQLKKKVVLIEKESLGGTCMNHGCIPAKFLLHQTKMYKETKENKTLDGPLDSLKCNWRRVQEQKADIVERFIRGIEFLLKRNGVHVVKGQAELLNEKKVEIKSEEERHIHYAEKVILATGSRPSELPFLRPNGKEIITSREALELAEIPQDMIVIGAGAIGLEMGVIFQRLGCKVNILEILPNILPGSDHEMVTRLERVLRLQGLNIHTQMKIQHLSMDEGKVRLKGLCLKDNKPFSFETQKVLLAVGRIPNSEEFKKLRPGFVDKKGFVKVNAYLETDLSDVFAIGDLIGGKLLAHKASHEGMIAAENACGHKREVGYEALPMAVYTEPEYASVGMTQHQALDRGIKIQIGVFPLQANGRALTMGKPEGMAKIIADEDDRVIGAHILAPNASELLAEITLCIDKGLRLQDISSLYHIHPTLSEAVMEAALKAKGEALHVLNI
jgi:dihydrolipoamide dehydrogenase